MSKKNDTLIWLITISATTIVLFAIFIWNPGMGLMGTMMGVPMMNWGLIFIVPIALGTILILGIYLFITGFLNTETGKKRDDRTPLEVLNLRYANGEITRDQYLRMKEELRA
jgi:uncharacterized membrane protein